MTVVLHIGTHKTGSTAIQRFAAANRARLRAKGLWYPSYDEIGAFVHYGHHHISHALANENGNRLSIEETRRFLDHVRGRLKPQETLFISAEPFYRHLLPAEGGYWAERRAYIERVRAFFPGDDIRVLAVVRRQDTFARSLYQERIKVTKYRASFTEFLSDRHPFEYYEHLSLFRDAFGTVDLLVYEDLAKKGLVDAFFAHLGVDIADIAGRPAANPSLPIDLVDFKRILNGTALKPERLKEIGVLLLDRAGKVSALEKGKADWLPAAEMAAFYESFAPANERLRTEFLPARSEPLFPPYAARAGADEAQVYESMSAQRFAQLAAELLL